MLKPTAKQGAARTSWNKGNPRIALNQLIVDHPKLKKEKIIMLLWDKVKADQDMIYSMFEYWVSNNYRDEPAIKYDREEIRKQINFIKEKALLSLPLPNGKPLKDATGKECLAAGGFYNRVGKMIPANEQVGSVLNEEQLQKIFKEKS